MTKKVNRRTVRYYCHECIVTFDVITFFEQRRKYCPKCGDYVAVKTSGYIRRPWNKAEKELLDKHIAGEVKFYTVVEKTGRTITACRKQKSRRIRELGLVD
jgi:uncharacterized paraquat-inducible protein A